MVAVDAGSSSKQAPPTTSSSAPSVEDGKEACPKGNGAVGGFINGGNGAKDSCNARLLSESVLSTPRNLAFPVAPRSFLFFIFSLGAGRRQTTNNMPVAFRPPKF